MLTRDDLAAIHGKAKAFDVVVAGAAVLRGGKVLVCTRSIDDDFLAGYAELPGGKVDPGETLWDGLHREIREETGLEIETVIEELPAMEYEYKGLKVRQCSFLVTCSGDPVLSHEHSALLWIDAGEKAALDAMDVTSEQRALIVAALERAAALL